MTRGDSSAIAAGAEPAAVESFQLRVVWWCCPARVSQTDLKRDKLYVVYPGEKHYPLAKYVEVVPLAELVNAD